ncbi:MAG: hypothetical protein FJ264_09100 [Planctomycetes bacterium]|nr:hypothetical protein [Planctomycetota bacterium]
MKNTARRIGLTFFTLGAFMILSLKSHGDDLYNTKLTVTDSILYDKSKLKANVSISEAGTAKISIENLQYLVTAEPVSASCSLVIETEINDEAETTVYEFPFEISDGDAEEEMILDGLKEGYKLEILSVKVTEAESATETPTPTASAAPSATPVATASASPATTPTATPAVTASPTSTPASIKILHSASDTGEEILVPGGLLSFSAATPTPSPTSVPDSSPSPEPSSASTPTLIDATINIQSKIINLSSNGRFHAYIELPSSYDIEDIVCDSIDCEGATAIHCKEKKDSLKVEFGIKDLILDLTLGKNEKETVKFTITGELEDGTQFEGSDTVKVKGKYEGTGNDDDDGEDEDEDEDEEGGFSGF